MQYSGRDNITLYDNLDMNTPIPSTTPVDETTSQLQAVLKQTWGYESFRAHQLESMQSVMKDRDSVVVLPTGGGKSLCYQVPAICREGLTVVVSPLISLMKDQVDALRANGIATAFLNSTLTAEESFHVKQDVAEERLKLLYVAPERLMLQQTIDLLSSIKLAFIAIDEAHCVSMWGHDFRPHYRELKQLKQLFPNVGVHAYTATATERVREDIANQLNLHQPELIVGNFDRPNLAYSVQQRSDAVQQICNIINRHRNESGIIYCITRKKVEETAEMLNGLGYDALPYHAGLTPEKRQKNQESFIQDRTNTIVATIAFGMGIDKPNVRYVIHNGLPKSLENYQQEAGRAGRDGLEADCALLYSTQDVMTWERIFSDQPEHVLKVSLESLGKISGYCHHFDCRHRQLVQHFGQNLEEDCGIGCDVCRGDFELAEEPLIIGQKILSSVHKQGWMAAAGHTAKVLKGSKDKNVIKCQHDQLSTYGLLAEASLATIKHWINQLIAQNFLLKTGEYHQLSITALGWQMLKEGKIPRLVQPRNETRKEKAVRTKQSSNEDSWEGVDRDLFDELRQARMVVAHQRGLQPYMVLGDETLRLLAKHRPSSKDGLLRIKGIGEKKQKDYGEMFLNRIEDYCKTNGVQRDIDLPAEDKRKTERSKKKLTPAIISSFKHFENGMSFDEVAEQMERAVSTVAGYFGVYIQHHKITDASPWVETAVIQQVETAIDEVGNDYLRPIFEQLEEKIDYNTIRTVAECRKQREEKDA